MKIRTSSNKYIFFLFFLITSLVKEIYSQSIGSMYFFQDNYQSQILNPAYQRNDNAIIVAVPGLSGISMVNRANFKITDLIRKQPNGDMAIDLEHFYNRGDERSRISDFITIPLIYVAIPKENGQLSFYYKEQIGMSLNMNTKAIQFFDNGNRLNEYKNITTEKASLTTLGYREFAGGFAFSLDEKTNIGIRAKILFGAISFEINNWEYKVETSETGEVVTLSSEGDGRFSVPYPMELKNGEIEILYAENTVGKYLTNFHNPGFAMDFGITHKIGQRSMVSFNANDLGGIWFRYNAAILTQNRSYDFTGFDLTNSLDYKNPGEFINRYNVVSYTKDSVRNVFIPYNDSLKYSKGIAPKTAFHYQYGYSEKILFGITNQTTFLKNNFINTLSVSSVQKMGGLSLFENINVHGLNQVSLGGGLYWETRFFQMILATDNLLAVYHPANQKSFSATIGISFLLDNKKSSKKSEGKFSPHRPFYRILD